MIGRRRILRGVEKGHGIRVKADRDEKRGEQDVIGYMYRYKNILST